MASSLEEKTIQEIERKWVLKRLPRDVFNSEVDVLHLEYAYLDGKRFTKRTVAGEASEYWITTKTGEGLSRKESHVKSNSIEFQKAKEDIFSTYLSKTRYVIYSYSYDLEIDDYHDLALVTMEAEIEMDLDSDHAKVAENFSKEKIQLPDSIENEVISEVTNIKGFSNFNLAY